MNCSLPLVLVFRHCDKTPERIYLKEELLILFHSFKFQSMVTWLHCFGACGEAEHQGGEYMMEQSCSTHCSQEA
jgi:hypothetical protein